MADLKDSPIPANQAELKANKKKPDEWKVEPSNLQYGTATPYIAIFDENGSPIVNPLTNIALGAYVNSFKFASGDETEDGLKMSIVTGNPDTADVPEIQEGRIIQIQFGYIYPDKTFKSSKVHRLKIKELEVIFNDKGTHIQIGALDEVSDLRLSTPYKPTGLDNRSMKDFMDAGLGLKVGIIIEMFE